MAPDDGIGFIAADHQREVQPGHIGVGAAWEIADGLYLCTIPFLSPALKSSERRTFAKVIFVRESLDGAVNGHGEDV